MYRDCTVGLWSDQRNDAGHVRFLGLPQAQGRDAHPAHSSDHGDRARSASLRGFEAGGDDFLPKPVGDVALVKRVRNLARLKMLTDEMLMRASTEEQLGF